ncbi:molybdopterin synthase catalytic subunit [Herbiconiux sp. SYSU D00978]|uniref:molybdopterin synthase catalytic subunit n=1 Tax=Herbiconiux sp. SYSU D00978 TaxID=2812562 RepID=UPI001A972FEA|nr:molybdenum cofactor biosynthesis protein MoaE [Herbiconiux sp. SYSU D00978]
MTERVLARIADTSIDVAEVEDFVAGREHGAVVTFRGVVRDHDGGETVTALDYQGHPDAEEFLRRVCTAVAAESGLPVAAVHRVGALTIGDVALAASVAAPHRAEAFAACQALVDRIKVEVPIWKKQHYDGRASDWVGL